MTFKFLAIVCIAFFLSPRCLLAAEEKTVFTEVQDLRYGVALFHYFQKEYMQALTELLIAKKQGGIQGHGDSPDIMEGGFTLAYGMERYASAIFDRVLEQGASPPALSAAWFYIAKVRYLRRDYEGAKVAMANMLRGDYSDLGEEPVAFRINIAIQQGDVLLAERILKREKPKGDWLPYINFNIGSAWARQNNFPAAVAYLTLLDEDDYDSVEHTALRDKATTAAGYSLLLDQRYDDALKMFSKVKLNSYLSSRALLGYGWAAVEKEDYEEALKAWDYLRQQTLADANSQEAMIAVPYAYEKLGAEGLALERFQEAARAYSKEIRIIDEVIANLEGDKLLVALNINRSEGVDWLNYARENQLSPQLTYLISLFSREEFQGVVQELRDLLALQENNRVWQQKSQFYAEMLDTRQQNRDLQSAFITEDTLREKISELGAKRSELAKVIEDIAASRDYFALATEDEADLVRRVERDREYVKLLQGEGPFTAEFEEATRRYYGLLLWNVSEKFSERLWLVIKKLNALDVTISEIRK
ncbi:MAG: tetratricopeptide repeat protein, partial [Cellvibrionaceae bacterium]|nr:tetratricopeptide repeat protein [Cellvibrionaceae bacterium]